MKLLRSSYLTFKELNKIGFKKIGENVKIDKNVIIPNPTNIELGNNIRIDAWCVLSASNKSKIVLNNNVHIGPFNLLYSADDYKIEFGDHSALAAGCKLYGRTENYDGRFLMNPTHEKEDIELITGNIILEKYATLGCDTVLFPESIIPIGTVLGSKSLYTAKEPLKEWSIYAGSPVKFFRERYRDCENLSNKYKTYNLEDIKYMYCNNKIPI